MTFRIGTRFVMCVLHVYEGVQDLMLIYKVCEASKICKGRKGLQSLPALQTLQGLHFAEQKGTFCGEGEDLP